MVARLDHEATLRAALENPAGFAAFGEIPRAIDEVQRAGEPTPGTSVGFSTRPQTTPDDFVCGVVLHTGERASRLDDRILAAPISRIWATERVLDSQH